MEKAVQQAVNTIPDSLADDNELKESEIQVHFVNDGEADNSKREPPVSPIKSQKGSVSSFSKTEHHEPNSSNKCEGENSQSIISQSILECGVCLSMICEPITISCGHTFCRVCLVASLRRSKKKCPSCRAVCHNSAEDQPENVMLANIAKSCFPAVYEDRLREAILQKQSWSTLLPIFYYNLPMFPGETLSLHLFEPRYKLMMQRIVGTSQKFAYVPNYSNYSASLTDVALLAELKEVEFLSDGRCLLEAKIVQRQRIMEHFIEDGTQGLHYCRTAPFLDDPIPSDRMEEVSRLAAKAKENMERMFLTKEMKTQILDHHGEMPTSPEDLSLWMTAILPLSIRDKQGALEMKNTEARLSLCVDTLTQRLSY